MKLVIEPASAIFLYSLILLPMPPNASHGHGLSTRHFGTVWATCMISKCCHYEMAGLNLSQGGLMWATVLYCGLLAQFPKSSHYKMASFNPPTQYEIGDWVEFPTFQAISTQKGGRRWLNQFQGGLKG